MADHEYRQLPAELLVELMQGDTLTLPITVTEDGTPIDWTGAIITAVVLAANGQQRAALNAVTSGGGLLTVTFPATTTTQLPPGTHTWRVRLTKTGTVRTLIKAALIIAGGGDG